MPGYRLAGFAQAGILPTTSESGQATGSIGAPGSADEDLGAAGGGGADVVDQAAQVEFGWERAVQELTDHGAGGGDGEAGSAVLYGFPFDCDEGVSRLMVLSPMRRARPERSR